MRTIQAGVPPSELPNWAFLERTALDVFSESVAEVTETYVRDDGRIRWPSDGGGLDDAYEGFSNWPLLYALGGDESVLEASIEQWEAITEQFSTDGPGDAHVPTVEEFPSSLDWMHQGEGHQFFYHICLAVPDHDDFCERARRFADYYLPGGEVSNYDAENNVVLGPETGSEGPSTPVSGPWSHAEWMVSYHLPFTDIEGVERVDDLRDPEKAARMSEALADRWRGDVAPNLAVTSLITIAYLVGGDERYREWVLDYVEAWRERTERNGGVIPDNVGESGEVGEHVDGRWYGGYYGWTWPHGWLFLGDAVVAAGENATVLDGSEAHLDAARSTIDTLTEKAIQSGDTLYVPYRHGDDGSFDYDPRNYESLGDERQVLLDDRGHVLWRDGWFEFRPMPARHPVHLWRTSQREDDETRLDRLANRALDVPGRILPGTKDAAGNEGAWAAYIRGEFPNYPEEILRHSLEHAYDRLSQLRETDADFTPQTDEFLNRRSPIDVEGLVHCTLGGPMPLYNGGLLHTRVRHFDPERERPGLPPDVAALVTDLQPDETALELVNIGCQERTVTVQAGAYGEHEFGTVTYESDVDGSAEIRVADIDDAAVNITLPGGTRTKCELETRRFVNDPSLAPP